MINGIKNKNKKVKIMPIYKVGDKWVSRRYPNDKKKLYGKTKEEVIKKAASADALNFLDDSKIKKKHDKPPQP